MPIKILKKKTENCSAKYFKYLTFYWNKNKWVLQPRTQWQPGGVGSLSENGYMDMYGWIPLLSACKYHSIANRGYPNIKLKVLKQHGVPHNRCYHVAPLSVEQRPWINQLCQQGGSPLGSTWVCKSATNSASANHIMIYHTMIYLFSCYQIFNHKYKVHISFC